jgi:hypothetical protein
MASTSCLDSLTTDRHRDHLKVVDTEKPGNQLQNSEHKELED